MLSRSITQLCRYMAWSVIHATCVGVSQDLCEPKLRALLDACSRDGSNGSARGWLTDRCWEKGGSSRVAGFRPALVRIGRWAPDHG